MYMTAEFVSNECLTWPFYLDDTYLVFVNIVVLIVTLAQSQEQCKY